MNNKNKLGITRREHFASLALQGLLATDTEIGEPTWTHHCWAREAVKYADALIDELNDAPKAREFELREALSALGVIGDGYCFCSQNRDPVKEKHEPECRNARHALSITTSEEIT